MFRWLNKSAIW